MKAADENLFSEAVNRSRIRDWLHGVRQIQPVANAAEALTKEPLTQSERYRQIHEMITLPAEDGGANITVKSGEWKNVEAIFPLHDHALNKKWLTEFTKKTFLTPDDLDQIRNVFGAKVSTPCCVK